MSENKREKFVQTEMQGIHRILEMHFTKKGELFSVKPTDKATQVNPDSKERAS